MLKITQEWLTAFPLWADAGWEVDDEFDLADMLVNSPNTQIQNAKTALANHPPTGPHH